MPYGFLKCISTAVSLLCLVENGCQDVSEVWGADVGHGHFFDMKLVFNCAFSLSLCILLEMLWCLGMPGKALLE